MARQQSSYELEISKPKAPRRSNEALWGALILLALGAVLAVLFVPSLRNSVSGLFTFSRQQQIQTDVTVWADKNAGSYYCNGSKLYGHGSGAYMKQGDALTMGYQPDLGQYCTGSQPHDSNQVAKGPHRASSPATAPATASPSRHFRNFTAPR